MDIEWQQTHTADPRLPRKDMEFNRDMDLIRIDFLSLGQKKLLHQSACRVAHELMTSMPRTS